MDRVGGGALSGPIVERALTSVQKSLEKQAMQMRVSSNDFDQVLEIHRKHVYQLRRQILLNMDRDGCDAYISKCVCKKPSQETT
jgi:preprotein translocase subunit SecA